jgi:hypothetical protein
LLPGDAGVYLPDKMIDSRRARDQIGSGGSRNLLLR